MGRHSAASVAARQRDPACATGADTAAYIGRVGLLAVALGVGAAVAGGTAIAGAETAAGNDTEQHSLGPSTRPDAGNAHRTPRARRSLAESPAAPPRSLFRAGRKSPATLPSDSSAEADEPSTATRGKPFARVFRLVPAPTVQTDLSPDEAPRTPTPELLDMALTVRPKLGSERTHLSPAAAVTTLAPAVPSPTDSVATEYGQIGTWMLEPNGQISDYGGQLEDGKKLLEPVNVILVDENSRTRWMARWRLDTAMRKAGFPAQAIHSGGFRGLIDSKAYWQQPTGLLGFSNNFFLLTNDHGRMFGPAPVKADRGYVWSGAFSTEEWGTYNGRPAHLYVSSNAARNALATALLASGQATDGGRIALGNAYNTDTTTTGDHDGDAVVLILK